MADKHNQRQKLLLYCCLGFVLLLCSFTPPGAQATTGEAATRRDRWTAPRLSNSHILATAVYTVDTDARGQTRIRVTGNGAVVTLATIQAGLGAPHANLLQDLGNGVWLLNANLFIDAGVTLNLGAQSGSSELRMRSAALVQAAGAVTTQVVTEPDGQQTIQAIDYSSFVYLMTHNGIINLDDIRVYSWDPAAGAVDEDVSNGRAYLLAKYDAVLNIRNSDIGYLGSADGESYGVSWRDINATATPTELRTRVTGEVINSKFHHLYYGIYTFQASQMVFQGNEFYANIRYGFDPHDYTHDVLVENNRAYQNGAHGFIISRGCNNFIIRNNVAYDNFDPGSNQAQGFMLDPGSPNSSDPQAPSYANLLENNEAYGNEGHGLRILGSIQNTIRNNNFHHNQHGIVVDLNSPDNVIDQNTLNQNQLHGLFIRETSDRTTATNNTTNNNGSHGIYVRANTNLISQNQSTANQGAGIALLPATGAPLLVDNQIMTNTLSNNLSNSTTGNPGNGLDVRGATRTLVQANLSANNAGSGIYVANSSSQNSLVRNLIRTNQTYGIWASGGQTQSNTWSENQIYANVVAGIFLNSGANGNLPPPQSLTLTGNTLSGVASPNVTVEIFADDGVQGHFFLGRTTATAGGAFSFPLAVALPAANLTALSIDAQGNSSGFSTALNNPNLSTPTPTATATATPTPTATPTASPSATATPTPTPSATATPTTTAPPTVTTTTTPTATAVGTPLATSTPTATTPPGVTPTVTLTATPSAPASPTITATATATIPPGATSTATTTPTAEPTTLPGGSNGESRLFLPLIER